MNMFGRPKRKISILLPIRREQDTLFIYLQKRSVDAKTLPNFFGFWGGGAENDESSEETLKREIQEELGIDLDLQTVRLFNHYEFLGSIKDVYLFEPVEGWEKSITIGEGDYGQWFKIEDVFLRNDIIFEDKTVINDLERLLLKKQIR